MFRHHRDAVTPPPARGQVTALRDRCNKPLVADPADLDLPEFVQRQLFIAEQKCARPEAAHEPVALVPVDAGADSDPVFRVVGRSHVERRNDDLPNLAIFHPYPGRAINSVAQDLGWIDSELANLLQRYPHVLLANKRFDYGCEEVVRVAPALEFTAVDEPLQPGGSLVRRIENINRLIRSSRGQPSDRIEAAQDVIGRVKKELWDGAGMAGVVSGQNLTPARYVLGKSGHFGEDVEVAADAIAMAREGEELAKEQPLAGVVRPLAHEHPLSSDRLREASFREQFDRRHSAHDRWRPGGASGML